MEPKKVQGKKGTLSGMSPERMDLTPFLPFVAQLRGGRGQVEGSRSKVPDSGFRDQSRSTIGAVRCDPNHFILVSSELTSSATSKPLH